MARRAAASHTAKKLCRPAVLRQCLLEVGMEHAAGTPHLLQLLGVSEGIESLAGLSPQAIKNRTFATLRQLSLRHGQQQTLILAVENLHWIDPTSEEWLTSLVACLAPTPLLLLTTYRPGYRPLWMDKSYATQIALARLTTDDSLAVVQSVPQTEQLPKPLVQEILGKAAGNPFFLEELTHAVVEDGAYNLPTEVPPTVQAVLAARIDRLPLAEKRLLQIASVVGKDVPFSLLQTIAEVSETVLDHGLGRLQRAEFLHERQSGRHRTYSFKHALTRDAAYQSLLRRTRQDYHQRIALVLAGQFPKTVETQPEILAYHYTAAGQDEAAIPYWQRAGQRALQRSAYVEAIAPLTQGLTLVSTLPATPQRIRQELAMQMRLGLALRATKGHAAPEVEVAYRRAEALCEQLEDTSQRFGILRGLHIYYLAGGVLQTALGLATRLHHLALGQRDPVVIQAAHLAMGHTLFFLGDFRTAHTHLEQGLALSDPRQFRTSPEMSIHPEVNCLMYDAHALCLLGMPDQARVRMQQALSRARALAHPFRLGWTLSMAARLYACCGERHAVQTLVDELVALSAAQSFVALEAHGTILQGWLLVMRGAGEAGLAQLRQGLETLKSTGLGTRPYFLALLAEASGTEGQAEAGCAALDEALAVVSQTGVCYWEAELHRLRGELLRSAALTPEDCFQKALEIARHQQAKSWELRAATSLARLWQSQDRSQDAYELLAPVYDWFTEGFDTADLKDAQSLLAELT